MPDVVGDSNAYGNISPFLSLYEEKLKREISDAVFALIDPPAPGDGEPEPVIDETLKGFCQGYIVYMAYYRRLPLMNVTIGDNGLQVEWSDTHRPATETQVRSAQNTILQMANASFENIILRLNSQKKTEWTSSEQFKQANRILFKDSSVFNQIISIDNNVRFFMLLNSQIYRFQTLHVEPILTTATLTALRTKVHAGTTLTEAENDLLELCLNFLAAKSISRAIVSTPEEDLPVCMLQKMGLQERDSYSRMLADQADSDLKILQKHVSDLALPDEAPHESIPDNSDTTRKTFRA